MKNRSRSLTGYHKAMTCVASGRPHEDTEAPHSEAIFHPELGYLSWTLSNGEVVVCRSYIQYKKNFNSLPLQQAKRLGNQPDKSAKPLDENSSSYVADTHNTHKTFNAEDQERTKGLGVGQAVNLVRQDESPSSGTEFAGAICGDGMCPYVLCKDAPNCKHVEDALRQEQEDIPL